MVYCFGETVIDIIFHENGTVTAVPGGSMFNTAVSLGRCGVPVAMISECGDDAAGKLAAGYLEKNGVGIAWLGRYSQGKTGIALAFLDERKDARYSFYKDYPELPAFPAFPPAGAGDIVLFGSSYALSDRMHKTVFDFVRTAKEAGALVIYDPNYRGKASATSAAFRERALRNIGITGIVRGSDEDFRNLFGAENVMEAFEVARSAGCSRLVYTLNRNGVHMMADGLSKHYRVPAITPVSTVGAGDAFNAGFLSFINGLDSRIPESQQQWDEAVATGIRFATEVCLSPENAIAYHRPACNSPNS